MTNEQPCVKCDYFECIVDIIDLLRGSPFQPDWISLTILSDDGGWLCLS